MELTDLDPSHVLPEYPRPQLVRDSFLNLNGQWDCTFTHADDVPLTWDHTIVVPFSPEAPLSGVNRTLQPGERLWYRRTVTLPEGFREDRLFLHFGAVDQDCEVFVDSQLVGEHRGGYLPFSVEIDPTSDVFELVVAVRDVTDTSYRSRGKQTLNPGGIWYSAQSGIWQTVWLESVPARHIEELKIVPHLASQEVEITVTSKSPQAELRITAQDAEVARLSVATNVPIRVPIVDPHVWTPEDPFLYDVTVTAGADTVTSYFGMRSVGIGKNAAGRSITLLNGKPYLHAGLLDQGYWHDGLYTAPTDQALIDDIQLAKDLGFTMLRKHIKIEPLRWYYHCDRLGMLVWQDMVNGGGRYNPAVITAPAATPLAFADHRHKLFARDDKAGRGEFLGEVDETVALLGNSPSVVTWVPFNEGWGQFDSAAVTQRVRSLDPTRLIDHASGWHDQGAGDFASRHVYFREYHLSDADRDDKRVAALTEYGGYSHRVNGHCYSNREFGYKRIKDQAAFQRDFLRLQHEEIGPAIDQGLSVFIYTQLSDVETETNGLVTYDRAVIKVDAAQVRSSNDRLKERFQRAAGAPARPVHVPEREITQAVSLTQPDGKLNSAAVGWTRTPLISTDRIGKGVRGKGRNKRWEYWAVLTPDHIVSLVVSDIDYAAVNSLWAYDRHTGDVIAHDSIAFPGWHATLPGTLDGGRSHINTRDVKIALDPQAGGTRLRGRGTKLRFDILAALPSGHERLGVVVPWTDTLFQYTVKDIARPASGSLWLDGQEIRLPEGESWAILDHGRGRWPYDCEWNWAAGCGRSNGHVVGIQLGNKWTDGTGSVENALYVDGKLTKISQELVWDYDPDNWMAPWRVTGDGVDLTLTPFYDKVSRMDLKLLSSSTHQLFGTWNGTARDHSGRDILVDGITGFAEEVHQRW